MFISKCDICKKMEKEIKKCFCLEFETGLTKKDKDICEKKLRIGRSMYNAFLNEALKRYNGYRHDERYKSAVKLYRDAKEHNDKEEMKALSDVMRQIQHEYNWYGKFCLNDMRKKQSNHFKGAIGSNIAVTLSQRAFRAVEKMEKNPDTKTVNFVKKDDDFSIEGADNKNGIIYRDGRIYFDIRKKVSVAIKPARKNDEAYYTEALQHEVKYCRLLSRTIRGKKRYYIQLVLDGTPPDHRKYGNEKINILDVKISHLEMQVEGKEKEIIELAPNCKMDEEKIATLQRKMDASRRATNPDNYNEDGTIKSGKLQWNYSNNYKKYASRLKELRRKEAVTRKLAHEHLTNQILEKGTDITIKSLSYKDLARRSYKDEINEKTGRPKSKQRFGKPIINRAPGEFINILQRKLTYIDKGVVAKTNE